MASDGIVSKPQIDEGSHAAPGLNQKIGRGETKVQQFETIGQSKRKRLVIELKGVRPAHHGFSQPAKDRTMPETATSYRFSLGPWNLSEVAHSLDPDVRRGGKAEDLEILRGTEQLIGQRTAGIVYGRNVIQRANSAGMTRALMAIVHEGATAEEAHGFLSLKGGKS